MPQTRSTIRTGRPAIWRLPALRLLLLVLLAEALIFQWAAFVPMPDPPAEIPAEAWALEGFSRTTGSDRVLTATEPAGVRAVTLRLPDAEMRALHLDAYSDRPGPLTFAVHVADERSATPRMIATGEAATGISRSRSILLWPAGKVSLLRLEFDLKPGERLFLNRLTINRKVPYAPDTLRILLLLAAGLGVWLLYTAPVFRRPARPDDLGQRLVITATGALIVVFCLWLAIASASAPFFDISKVSGDLYSKDLTDALLRGRFDLLAEPPPGLSQLANPYDPAQRAALPAENLVWDAAWFNGRYYVSYGIVPVLLLYAPFRALSGYYFQTAWAVCLFGMLGSLLLFLNLRRLLLILFPRLAFRFHWLAALTACAASFAGWGLARPKFYEAASLGGFLFLMLAAGQLLRAVYGRAGAARRSLVREAVLSTQPEPAPEPIATVPAKPIAPASAKPIAPASAKPIASARPKAVAPVPVDGGAPAVPAGRLLLAGLFLMLAIGCQPVLAIALLPYAAVLVLLLRRAGRSRQLPEVIVCALLPILAGGALLGAYNEARFGSMLEFGGQYRLTLADMRAGFPRLAWLMPGLGQHLLAPPVIDTIFPFVHFPAARAFSPSAFLPADGRTVGLLTLPALAILPLAPLIRPLRRAIAGNRQVWPLLAGSAATGLLIAAHDSLTLGIQARSAIDFAVWLALAAILAWLAMADTVDNRPFLAAIHKDPAACPQIGDKSGETGAPADEARPTAGRPEAGLSPDEKRRPRTDAWFTLFLVACGLTLALCALLFLQGENDRIRTYMPHIYEQLRRTLAFWLP